jgi:hypothetical protein
MDCPFMSGPVRRGSSITAAEADALLRMQMQAQAGKTAFTESELRPEAISAIRKTAPGVIPKVPTEGLTRPKAISRVFTMPTGPANEYLPGSNVRPDSFPGVGPENINVDLDQFDWSDLGVEPGPEDRKKPGMALPLALAAAGAFLFLG